MALGSKGPLPTPRPSYVIRRASNAVSRGHTDHTNEQKLPYLIFLLVHTFGNRALLRTITQGWACRTTRKWEDETKQKGSKQKTGILAMCIAGPVFFFSFNDEARIFFNDRFTAAATTSLFYRGPRRFGLM